jgi:hypothetical protein
MRWSDEGRRGLIGSEDLLGRKSGLALGREERCVVGDESRSYWVSNTSID